MRTRTIVAAVILLLVGMGPASAQVLSLEFKDGRVRLTAENVPASQILAEWSRRGGTTIVNGERVPGAPLTLQLEDVTERQALEVVLRGAAGYMALGREETSPGMSMFDKVMVLPTTARAPAPTALAPAPPPPQPQPQQPQPQPQQVLQSPEPDDSVEVDQAEQPDPPPGPAGRPPAAFPRGRVPQGLNLPNTAPNQTPSEDDAAPTPVSPAPPGPGNPFGITPGSNKPGVINPPPAPRDPNDPPRTR